MKVLLLVSLLALPMFSRSAEPPDVPKRKAQELELVFDGGRKMVIPYPSSPMIDEDGQISIIPGERLAVRFTMEGNKLVKPLLEKEKSKEKDCVIFDCKHEDGGLFLSVKNPFDQELHYRCGTIQHGKEDDGRIEGRRNLPVGPKMSAFEAYSGTEVILFFKSFELKPARQPAK